MKALFCQLYVAWFKYIVTPEGTLFTRFIDTFKSDCMYCTAARAMILAFGIMLVPWFWPASIPVIASPWLLALAERKWLCDSPGEAK